MLTLIRRIVVILILLTVGYFVYAWINPTGGEKIKQKITQVQLFGEKNANVTVKEITKQATENKWSLLIQPEKKMTGTVSHQEKNSQDTNIKKDVPWTNQEQDQPTRRYNNEEEEWFEREDYAENHEWENDYKSPTQPEPYQEPQEKENIPTTLSQQDQQEINKLVNSLIDRE